MVDGSTIDFLARELIETRDAVQALDKKIDSILAPAATTLLSKAQVGRRLGISPRSVDREVAAGRLPPGRLIGARRRWSVREIEEAAQ